MKISFRLLLTFSIIAFAGFVRADDFKSEAIPFNSDCSICPIRVHGNQFMVIRNFTQDGFSVSRGVITVTPAPFTGLPVNVLTAAILDTSTVPPEIINSIVIAGPADVNIYCGNTAGNCFVTYRKDSSN